MRWFVGEISPKVLDVTIAEDDYEEETDEEGNFIEYSIVGSTLWLRIKFFLKEVFIVGVRCMNYLPHTARRRALWLSMNNNYVKTYSTDFFRILGDADEGNNDEFHDEDTDELRELRQ